MIDAAHFAGVNRREFLGAAGASLLAGPAAWAADAKPDFTFALVSDNHLGRKEEAESKRMKLTVEEINASAAELTFFCGDLVDNGQKEENEKRYGEWVEIAKALKKPFRAVPGNHDPDALFLKHVQKETDVAVEHKDYRFVCFRDAEVNPGHDGIVTPEQLKWLKGQLEDAGKKGQRVVLVAHVIYHENKAPDQGWYIKKGREEFGKLLEANKQVVAFVTGHLHCGLRGWDDTSAVQEVVLPSTSWNSNRGLEKTPGYNVNEFRPGYVLVEVFGDRLSLRYKPIGEKAAEAKELPLRKA